ncbi:MAG: hypothetical protein J5962_03285 [Lachnospiraceae bacterium]|nr:hypothetical protein [Lachnospiraceae bacterium]
MKNKKRWIAAIPLTIIVICMLILHTKYQCGNDDQVLKATVLKPTVMEEFSSIAYNFTSWSSRVLVNLPIHILLHFSYIVWMVIELVMWAVIAWSLSYIFVDNDRLRKNIVLMAAVLHFPLNELVSAGWITTTMTYIWPMAAGLAALTAIRIIENQKQDAVDGTDVKRIKWYHYLIYALLVIYGAHQEQMSIFLFMIFGAYSIYAFVKKEKQPLIWMEWFFAAANLVLHMLTPGNEARNLASVEVYFPNYLNLSVIDKLEIGFSSTLYPYVFNKNTIFVWMSLLLCILVWQKHKELAYRILGAMPLLIHLFFARFCTWLFEEKLNFALFTAQLTESGVITEATYYNWRHYIPMVVMFAMGIFLLVDIYLAFGDNFKSILAGAILFGGLAGRMVVAFSSTVWASLNRTYTVFNMALIMLMVMFVNEIELDRLKKMQYVLYALIIFTALLNVQYVYKVI